MVKLTPQILKSAQPEPGKRLELRDDDEPGLIFRVTETGARSWSVRYRTVAGQQRRQQLGAFPAIGLSKARELAKVQKGAVATGKDPVAAKRAEQKREAQKRLRTFDGLADAYFTAAALGLHKPNARRPKGANTMKEERRIYDQLIAKPLGKKSIEDIKRPDIQAFADSQTKIAKSNGRHCRNVLRQLLSYAVWKELLDHNPAHNIGVVEAGKRDRLLKPAEIKSLWGALERPQDIAGLSLSPEMALALQFALVTLQRGGEVVSAAWREIDLDDRVWTIPAARMKARKTHLVPLSQLAVGLLERAQSLIGGEVYVFQSPRSGDEDPLPLDRHSFSRAMGRVVDKLKIEHATPHDFRRAGVSNMTSERLGIPRFIASQVIAHGSDTGGAAAVTGDHYDMNDYLPEKRRALDAWADLLSTICNGTPMPGNVVPLRKTKA